MILRCSADHEIDTESKNLWDLWHGRIYKKPGDRCRAIIGFDVMGGTVYCRRILKEVVEPETRQNA